MSEMVIHNVDLMLTMDGDESNCLGALEQAALLVQNGRVVWVGPSALAPPAELRIDGAGCVALPGLVDCHTHAVWAGSRSDEFRRRLAGESYSAILEGGGGILSTVNATRQATLNELVNLTTQRLKRLLARGVTTVEVKSGYGLEPETELKMLHAAQLAGERAGLRVLKTFLGAHAIPADFRARRQAYVAQVIEEQLPLVAELADFIDVYVDRGAFTLEEGRQVLQAGKERGLTPRIHAEQVVHTGAAAMAAELGAISADHLEQIDDVGISALAANNTTAVLLPGAMLYLKDPPPPVEALRKARVPMAVASDLNPGSSPVGDLWACASLGCVLMGLTVEEALRGITCVAAAALGRDDIGVLKVGNRADILLMQPPPGEPPTAASLVQYLGLAKAVVVVRDGRVLADNRPHRRGRLDTA
ncbi:MAG: imidazolonepropionase [Proteobacteria bacterium]|nr:imidazolonepropionase [Pseudomonadota bacterium]